MNSRQQNKTISKFFAQLDGKPCAAITARETQWFNANGMRRFITSLDRTVRVIEAGMTRWAIDVEAAAVSIRDSLAQMKEARR